MGAIKKIRVELLLLFLVTLNIFTTFSLDINIQSYFKILMTIQPIVT